MKNTRLKFFLALFLIALSNTYSLQKQQFECEPYPYSRVALKHREHKGVGWDKGYTTLSFFLAPRNNHVLVPFFDARFHAFNNGYIASNLGVGARFAPISDDFVVGFNTYYDFREYKSFSSHQASGGIEFLTSAFDFRLNGYYPFSGKTDEKYIYFHRFQKNSAYLRQDILYSLPSADAEIGFELPEPMKQVQLYLAFGSYYLFKTHADNHSIGNAIGYKARLTATPEDYISFGVEYTHDRLFNNRVNGYISFQVPLGKKKAKTKSKHKYYKHRNECASYYTGLRRKTQDPYHNEIIPFYDETFTFNSDRITTNPNHFIFVNNTNLDPAEIGSGSGTFEDPYTTLKLGEINSSPGDIIYVFYGRGNDDGYNKGFIFKPRQILTSSSVDLDAKGFVVPAYTPGQEPKVSNQFSPSSNTISALDCTDILLQGFTLSSLNTNTISYKNSSVKIRNNTVTAFNNDAIYLENCSAILQNNIITAPAGNLSLLHEKLKDSTLEFNIFNEGIKIIGNEQQANLYKINNNRFNVTSNDAIDLENPAVSLSINNNVFSSKDNTNTAIQYIKNQFSSENSFITTSYKNNNIVKGFSNGIHHEFLTTENESTTFLENIISSTSDLGIYVKTSSQAGNCSILENSILSGRSGIEFFPLEASNITCFIDRNRLTNNGFGFSNILVETQSQGKISITNNELRNISLGIKILNKNSNSLLYSYEITQNTIETDGPSVQIVNAIASKGSTYGSILNNKLQSKNNVALDLSVNDFASGNICTSFSGNQGIGGGQSLGAKTWSDTEGGVIAIKSATADPKVDNPGFETVITANQVTFVLLSSTCPRYSPIIYVDNTNSKPNPDGSRDNPFPTLKQAEASSTNGDVIYVFTGDGTTRGYDQGIILKKDQVIGSSAVTFTAAGITFPGDGGQPPKITSNNSPVITGAEDTKVIGLCIIPSLDQNGINTSVTGSIEISENEFISKGTSRAIVVNSPNAQIDSNRFDLTDSSIGIGYAIISPNTSATGVISNNVFKGSSLSRSFDFELQSSPGTCNLTIEKNSFNSNGTLGALYLNSSTAANSFKFNDNQLVNQPLFAYFNGPSNTTMNGNQIVESNNYGINIQNAQPLVVTEFSNNTFLNSESSLAGGLSLSLSANACVKNVVNNNNPKGRCSFLFGLEENFPILTFEQTKSAIESNNLGVDFSFNNITPNYGSSCP